MLNENNWVEKSRNLVAMECLNLQENELKILDVYLSRINPRNKATRAVTFDKSEYEELMGLSRVYPERLGEYVDHLMSNVVTIPMPEGGWEKYILFTKATCKNVKRSENDEVGKWVVELSSNPELESIFFNIDTLGYIKYRLRNIIKLKHKYDIKLYLFLKSYEYKKPYTFEISLDKLKQKIECDAKSYDLYKTFSQFILKPAIKAINDFTDIWVEYEKPRKKKNEEEKIIFTVKSKAEYESKRLEPKVPEEQHEPKEVAEQPGRKNYNLPDAVLADAEQEDIEIMLNLIKEVYKNADKEKIDSVFARVNVKCTFPEDVKSPYKYYRSILKAVLSVDLENKDKDTTKKTAFHNQQETERKDIDLNDLVRKIKR